MKYFDIKVFTALCLFHINICNGWPPKVPSVIQDVSAEGSCKCLITTTDLSQIIAYMDQNVIKTVRELKDLRDSLKRIHEDVISSNTKLTDMRHITDRLDRKQKLLLEEIKGLKTDSVVAEDKTSREYYPVAAPLLATKEKATSGNDHASETNGNAKENLTNLFDELTAVKNLTLGALQENSDIKQELEVEKRSRRSLQTRLDIVEEGLNQTQAQVQIVNEKVIGNYYNISTSGEILYPFDIAKLYEMNELNKTIWENKLKTLEYRVNDVYRNGTFLTERLDNVENITALATNLWENGTLIKRIDDMETILKNYGNYEENFNETKSLRNQVLALNSSFIKEMDEMHSRLVNFTDVQREEMYFFKEKVSQINHTRELNMLNEMLLEVVENNKNTNIQAEKAMNGTIDQTIFSNFTFHEGLRKFSELVAKTEDLEKQMSPVLPLATEIENFRNVIKSEMNKMETNFLSQIQAMNRTFDALFFNTSDSMDLKSAEMREKHRKIDLEIRQILSDIWSLESRGREQSKEVFARITDLKQEYLSDISKYASTQNESMLSLNEEMTFVRKSQLELEGKIANSINNLEDTLMKEMYSHKVDVSDLKEDQKAMMLLLRRMESNNKYVVHTATDLPSARSRSGGENILTHDDIREESMPCVIPEPREPHLLIMDLDEGTQPVIEVPHGHELTFACKHVGRYVLNGDPTVRCTDGRWSGPFPKCKELVEERKIREAARIKLDPCLQERGQFPDPDDCTKFYDCWDGNKFLRSCPSGLHFDEKSQSCDYPSEIACNIRNRTAELGNLLNIIPPITFDPITINAAYSLVASSALGEIVVYPGVTLNIHCLYPRVLGELRWEVPDPTVSSLSSWETRGVSDIKEAYKLTLHLPSVSERYSGNYTCITPTLRKHTVKILIKDTECQPLELEASNPLKIFYRPHPDVSGRIFTTVALFDCPDGHLLEGSTNVTCLGTGHWSHPTPRCLRDVSYVSKPRCNNINFIGKLGLQQIEPEKTFYNAGDKVHFKCSANLMLKGNAFSTCKDNGEWTGFPQCLKLWN